MRVDPIPAVYGAPLTISWKTENVLLVLLIASPFFVDVDHLKFNRASNCK